MSKSTRRSFLAATLAAPLFASCVTHKTRNQSSTSKLSDITEILTAVRNEAHLPAVAAGAMKKGALLALGAVGVRKMGDPTPVTASDKFHIGSCTKAMTATLAAMLVERHKLHWTDTLAKIFPERAAKMHPDYRAVTLEMLLTHRSGAPANGEMALLFPDLIARRLLHSDYQPADYPLPPQRLAYMDAVLSQPPETKPRSTFNYSNAGYIIAGAILERVTNGSWEQLIRQRLFGPLKMRSAGFGPPSNPAMIDEPWGHVLQDGKYQPIYGDNPPAHGPAGTVHCALADYLKFADFHASMGLRPRGILSPASLERLHQPWSSPSPLNGERAGVRGESSNNYAFGWAVLDRNWARDTALTHHGTNTMNYFIVWIAPTIGLSLAIAANAGGDQMPIILDKIAAELVRRFAS